MTVLLVIENPEECPPIFQGEHPVAARTYLTDESYASIRGLKVYNICLSYRYQSIGYYVSLLAEARGHKAIPSMTTVQDMKSVGIIRRVSEELQEIMAKHLDRVTERRLSLRAYFGRSAHSQLDSLTQVLFKRFPAAFLQADFSRAEQGWNLVNVSALSVRDIPSSEQDFARGVAQAFFDGKRLHIPKRTVTRFDLAILVDPKEDHPPSDDRALKKFMKAADKLGIGSELITRDDANRLGEFDALFIRTTTSVDHYTYRLSRKAVAEGVVVIDDPESILRCCNKVYLAERMSRNKVPIPKTLIVHSKNLDQILPRLDLPCVLKQPDSSYSQGVYLIRERSQLMEQARKMLARSDLIIAQEYLPSEYDWRIGVLDRAPLYACKYFMASRHWQIIRTSGGREYYGRVQATPLDQVPGQVLRTALKAANLMGDGLYGVDLKQVGKKVFVIEVNDNPSLEAGYEDQSLGDDLYRRIIQVFLDRIQKRVQGNRTG